MLSFFFCVNVNTKLYKKCIFLLIYIYIYGTIFNGKRFISASKGINKKGEREKMNKFKKILLGTLSVLTLGLFVATGARVDAAIILDNGTSARCEYTLAPKKATWDFTPSSTASTINVTDAMFFGLKTSTNTIPCKKDGTVEIADTTVLSIPVPTDSYGKIKMYYTSNNSSRYWSYGDDKEFYQTSKNTEISSDYEATDITTTDGNSYLVLTENGGVARLKYISIEIDNECNNNYSYRVTFNSNGGTCEQSYANASTSTGKVNSLPTPILDGSEFLGWYTKDGSSDNDWGSEFTTNTVVSENVTIYAKWSSVDYWVVNFVSEDVTIKSVDVDKNSTVGDEWPSNPTKMGYVFDGWFDSENNEYTPSTVITSGVTLTAKFSLNTIAIGSESNLNITSVKSSLTSSVDRFENGKFIIHEADSKTTAIQGTANSGIDELNFNNNNIDSYVLFSIPANSIAKIAICGRSAKDGSTGQLTVKNGSTTQDIQFASNSSYKTHMVNVINSTSEDQLVYVYRSNSTGSNVCALNVKVVENVDNIAKNALVNIDAEMNTDKSVLRLITTISGVELASIEKIELILLKDGVATKDPVYVSTVYTSVSGAADLYEEGTNTYFGITKISKAQSIKNSVITMNVVVTFTGDVTCTSATKTFTVPEA